MACFQKRFFLTLRNNVLCKAPVELSGSCTVCGSTLQITPQASLCPHDTWKHGMELSFTSWLRLHHVSPMPPVASTPSPRHLCLPQWGSFPFVIWKEENRCVFHTSFLCQIVTYGYLGCCLEHWLERDRQREGETKIESETETERDTEREGDRNRERYRGTYI